MEFNLIKIAAAFISLSALSYFMLIIHGSGSAVSGSPVSAAALLILQFMQYAGLLFLFRFILKSRKKAIREIEESEEKYRVLVENSFDVIYRVNADGIFTFASPSWSVILGHDLSDVVGKSYTDFIHPDDAKVCADFIKEVINSNERHSGVDYRVRHVDGEWRFHTSSAVPVQDENGMFSEFVGIAKDITERKKAEDEIKKLLREKELLLKEVHHRIKNNMGAISSLLYLQSEAVKNDIASSMLKDARNRVQGMMGIYDKLYRSADFRNISAKDYLSTLINGISLNSGCAANVKIETEIEDSVFDSEVLFPVGIIINELLSNSCKYAFPDGRNGVIRISFLRLPDGFMEIIFQDNGIGIPGELINGESAGFGSSLVKSLIKQIKGDLDISNNKGTEYRIRFPSG